MPYIYSATIRLKNGKRLVARDYGIEAFRFWVDEEAERRPDLKEKTASAATKEQSKQ